MRQKNTPWNADNFTSKSLVNSAAPPCFYAKACRGLAEVSKCGKGVCRKCAATMPGAEYPYHAPIVGDVGKINRWLDMAAAWPSV